MQSGAAIPDNWRPWLVNGAVALVLLIAGGFAISHGLESSAFKEARGQAETLLLRMAGCAARRGTIAATSVPVPRTLAMTDGTFEAGEAELTHPVLRCINTTYIGPLIVQIQWQSSSQRTGFAFAQADTNGDGLSDQWFEIPVRCKRDGCEHPNYVFDVDEKGTRSPPALAEGANYSGSPPGAPLVMP